MKGVDMKIMYRLASLLCSVVLIAGPAAASDTEELTTMLQEFLATSDQETAHASFWADDLIYTSSAGLRFGKADIMAGFEGSDADDSSAADTPPIVYSGEDVDIRLHGDTAIVAFKLVGTPTDKASGDDVLYYFNTGTFLKRDGVWKVIAWQATKIPPT
jgi:ketosteroid isomerase-like protein